MVRRLAEKMHVYCCKQFADGRLDEFVVGCAGHAPGVFCVDPKKFCVGVIKEVAGKVHGMNGGRLDRTDEDGGACGEPPETEEADMAAAVLERDVCVFPQDAAGGDLVALLIGGDEVTGPGGEAIGDF